MKNVQVVLIVATEGMLGIVFNCGVKLSLANHFGPQGDSSARIMPMTIRKKIQDNVLGLLLAFTN